MFYTNLEIVGQFEMVNTEKMVKDEKRLQWKEAATL